jgi:NAD(P)-dependent dehydrogenase (short-subunit alcohol dehydrogenase family)
VLILYSISSLSALHVSIFKMGFLHSQLFVTPAYPTTSCAGQTIIVTGSNVGLGKEAARHFARLGASKIILAVRNSKAGEEAKKDIEISTKCGAKVLEVWTLDLLSYESCKSFADRASKLPRLDVLLENAGVAGYKWSLAGAHERMIAVNVISTFYLAMLMLPKLKSSAKEFGIKPRLVIVSSEVHARTRFPEWKEPNIFDALDDESKARMEERYPTSKLLEVLVIRQMAPQLEGSGVILNMLNPGLCHSELAREGGPFLAFMKFLLARTTEVGSRTLVAAAVAGSESHGKYMTDAQINDDALSDFVKSADGKEASKKVWKELREILDSIQPGVTSNL